MGDFCSTIYCFDLLHVVIMIECGNNIVESVCVAIGLYCVCHIHMCFVPLGYLTNLDHESAIYHYLG
jgi:hypothetical protein